MSLVKAERRRFFKRRMTVWMLVIGLAILGAIGAGFVATHSKHTPEAVAAGEAKAKAAYAKEVREFEDKWKKECEATSKDPAACQGPPAEYFTAEHYMKPEFDFKLFYGEILIIWAAIMAMIAFVLGATYIGAEWSSGAMMNLLTWRPKRISVLGTKLGVLLGSMAAIGTATLLLWTGMLWGIAKVAGHTNGMTGSAWGSFGLAGLRGVAMIMAFAALGFGLASLGRHTALALGVAIGVVIVGQIGLSIVLAMADVPFFERYLIPVHMDAWLKKSVELEGGGYTCGPSGCIPEAVSELTYKTSGLIGLAVVVAVTALAFWSIKRRDVA
ncbi:ABC transporter permease subunit [Catelliglobosispora koreensis]|uniref:ABC transporter permease subunit n=1 Tax=Catelliglobosispora koreensis TaxID=129052 RepID=UPI0003701206|nr:ABC transporter permease subunit [Catelliglobosispora koreensis]